jgi:hypothetical protein
MVMNIKQACKPLNDYVQWYLHYIVHGLFCDIGNLKLLTILNILYSYCHVLGSDCRQGLDW